MGEKNNPYLWGVYLQWGLWSLALFVLILFEVAVYVESIPASLYERLQRGLLGKLPDLLRFPWLEVSEKMSRDIDLMLKTILLAYI